VEVVDEGRKKDAHGHDGYDNDEHEHSHGIGDNKKELIRLGIGAAFFIIALAFKMSTTVEFGLYFASYLLTRWGSIIKIRKKYIKGAGF